MGDTVIDRPVKIKSKKGVDGRSICECCKFSLRTFFRMEVKKFSLDLYWGGLDGTSTWSCSPMRKIKKIM